jgi:hypothetical protein
MVLKKINSSASKITKEKHNCQLEKKRDLNARKDSKTEKHR